MAPLPGGPELLLSAPRIMTLTAKSFLKLIPLNPLLARQRLIQAVETGTVTFPQGTSEQSLLPWLWQSELFFLEPEEGSPDTTALIERYGIHRQTEGDEAPSFTGFPLTSVLELLARIAHGEHPRFTKRVYEIIQELVDPDFSPWDVEIIFHTSPQ
jgi:hypothetical protein